MDRSLKSSFSKENRPFTRQVHSSEATV